MDNYDNVPYELRPISPWEYFFLSILFALPIIGFIALIVCSLSSSNINRRNYARSYFCIVIIILVIIGLLLASGGFATIIAYISRYIK